MDSCGLRRSHSAFSWFASSRINDAFSSVCLPSRDDPDDFVLRPIAVAHNQCSQRRAHPQENEAVLLVRVIWVVDEKTSFVVEHGFRLFKKYPVLLLVRPALGLIPFEEELWHIYNILTT